MAPISRGTPRKSRSTQRAYAVIACTVGSASARITSLSASTTSAGSDNGTSRKPCATAMAASARAEGSFEVRRASSASWYGRGRSLSPAAATQSEKPTTMAGTDIGSRITQACAKTERRPGGEPPGRHRTTRARCPLLLLVLFGHGSAAWLRLATLLVLRVLLGLRLTAVLLALLVLVELNGAAALLIVPVGVHLMLFLVHGSDSFV